MNNATMLEFIKEWRSLERDRKDLDYKESNWCDRLRSQFPDDTSGDRAFAQWLSVELGLSDARYEELLSKAKAFALVSDRDRWDVLGGYMQIRLLIPLDAKERVAVMGAAISSGYRISTVIRQRQSRPEFPSRTPDIVLLAEFIEQLPDAPDGLREIARRYIRANALKVA